MTHSTPAPTPSRTARLVRHLPKPVQRRAARLPGALAPPVSFGTPTPRIAVIGTGFGGLGMGARLRQAGIESFTIYEKEHQVGGTWRDNTYPGAACDVPSHLYSLSFAPKADWTRKFPQQPEILAYLESVVDRFGLGPHLRFGTELSEATHDEDRHEWRLRFADGTDDVVDVLVVATGQLNRPWTPPLSGLADFAGTAFHSARWPAAGDPAGDLGGKDVAVVGIGASAIQFVPEVAKAAHSVTLFQRSVNYVAPKADAEFKPATVRRFQRFAWLQRLYRFTIWARFEAHVVWFRKRSWSAERMRWMFRRQLRQLVSEELPEHAVVPDYPIGCRRLLISNDWYPTLLQPQVEVVTAHVERVTETGVRAGGREHRADVLIFGTGFTTTAFLVPMRIVGRDGVDLHERWVDGAEAHLGMTVAGFPNLFVLYGPNTNLGHNSIIFMLERQISYVLSCVRRMVEDSAASLEVRQEVEAASNRALARRLDGTVWASSCHSWYKTASGKITNNWAGPTLRYWAVTARPKRDHFEATPRRDRSEALAGHR